MALSMDSGVLSIAGDVRDRSAAERLVAAALARFGRIYTLVNNAGIFLGKPFTEYTAQEFSNVVDANLAGFFHTMQLVLPHMLRQGSGHIVQITTTPRCTQAIAGAPSGLALLNKGGLDAVTRGPGARWERQGRCKGWQRGARWQFDL